MNLSLVLFDICLNVAYFKLLNMLSSFHTSLYTVTHRYVLKCLVRPSPCTISGVASWNFHCLLSHLATA